MTVKRLKNLYAQMNGLQIKKIVQINNEIIDENYRNFLDNFELKNEHKDYLMKLGLSDMDVVIHGYKSQPFGSGILIPIRNHKNLIFALTARNDRQLFHPPYRLFHAFGNPVIFELNTPLFHFATIGKPIKREFVSEIVLTVGELQANIMSEQTDVPVVGIHASFVGDVPESEAGILTEAFPHLESVKIALGSNNRIQIANFLKSLKNLGIASKTTRNTKQSI